MIKYYLYPRLVGGQHDGKTAPEVPRRQRWLEMVHYTQPPMAVYVRPEDDPLPATELTFRRETYARQKVGLGKTKVLTFWAHTSLPGEDACDRLFTQMLKKNNCRRDYESET